MNEEGQISERTLAVMIWLLAIFGVIAVTGAGFGIYGTIQANRALNYLKENDLISDEKTSGSEIDVDDDLMYTYGKPSSVDKIEYVGITYNGGEDFIDVYDGSIEYSAYSEEEDDYVGDMLEVDTQEYLQYVFDNALEYLGDNEVLDDETWSVEVDTTDGNYSYASGTGAVPEWVKALLEKFEVEKNGYKSREV